MSIFRYCCILMHEPQRAFVNARIKICFAECKNTRLILPSKALILFEYAEVFLFLKALICLSMPNITGAFATVFENLYLAPVFSVN